MHNPVKTPTRMIFFEFFISDDPSLSRLAFLGSLCHLLAGKKRSIRKMVFSSLVAFLSASHGTPFFAEIFSVNNVPAMGFVVGSLGGIGIEVIMGYITKKYKSKELDDLLKEDD